jgi:glutathione peroxidase-family protein
VKVQWNNIKKYALDAAGDLVDKVKKKTRESRITQEMTNKTGE